MINKKNNVEDCNKKNNVKDCRMETAKRQPVPICISCGMLWCGMVTVCVCV